MHWPGRFEQLAALGILICLGGLPLPWYRVRFDPHRVQSGLGSFGFGQGALLLTLVAAGLLLYRGTTGRRPPAPLHSGTLLAVAGGWSAALVAILTLDRPTTTIEGLRIDYGLTYGALVSFVGAVILIVAGLRLRRDELRAKGSRGPRAARGPSAASPPRSSG